MTIKYRLQEQKKKQQNLKPNKMDTIVMPITGKKVKVALSDFPEPMTWEDASNACKSLGKGWR